ncbi:MULTISPECIES: hypothetical protein [Pseudomonas]|uniref:Uncharacterized protein n=1 Tax=Pseudomonas eucalypticola TaxID=2599595 RepID=A0A7D5D5K7_9PSED|nr:MULTISPECIES: hypothetical protein [Pseudomonas]QKZ03252.1 hypothetical protein HWQ56_05415 [Pseudomonas eucalypticola]
MSNSMGIASAFILSSLLLSPFAMAEESPAFAARNEAIQANLQQHQEALAQKTQQHENSQQAEAAKPQAEDIKAS